MRKLQFQVLYREFLFRMVDLEVLSADALGDSNKLLGRFASLLVFFSVGLFFGALIFTITPIPPAARFFAIVRQEHFLIATTMLVAGLFAVLSWDSTFPNRRDVLVLAPLPVRAQTMFIAKVAAVATALCLTVGLLHGLGGLVWPLALSGKATPQIVPTYAFDPPLPPVSASGMQSVLDRDFAQPLASGSLAPVTHAGLSIAVFKNGDARVFSYGAAQPDSIFQIGAISETFTAWMLARMSARQEVDPYAPLRRFLPDGLVAKPIGDEITLGDLATQHSGLPRLAPPDWPLYLTRRGVDRAPHPPPRYSNFAFGLLGYALAAGTNQTFADLLQRQITDPLGLSDTVVSPSPEQQKRAITGYYEENYPARPRTEILVGSDAIWSSAGDMLKFVEANLREMSQGSNASSGAAPASVWQRDPTKAIWFHSGAISGFSANAFFSTERHYAAVVLLNYSPSLLISADRIAEHIRQRLEGGPALSIDSVLVPASMGFAGTLRWFGAYWFTMLAAGAFIYCGVLGVQGLAAQLLPRRLFLRASGLLQLSAFCLFVSVYFLQPTLTSPDTFSDPQIRKAVLWLPSAWFLGLFQQLNGSMHPAYTPLAHRAWLGLAFVIGGTAVAYATSYTRTLRRIIEEPDITPGSRGFGWLPPFGSRVQTAIGQFAVRTLVRSRQHRVILAFYLGIGFALMIFLLKAPSGITPTSVTQGPIEAASILMMLLAVMGTRVVFAMPLDLRANWIFRIAGVQPGRKVRTASRRALLLIAVAPVVLAAAPLCWQSWPWQAVAGHLAVMALTGVIVVDLCLHGFRKLPFTCSYLSGKSQVHMVFLYAICILYLVMYLTHYEQQALDEPRSAIKMIALLALAAVAVRRGSAALTDWDTETLEFEDSMTPAVMELGLHRDGATPVGAPRS